MDWNDGKEAVAVNDTRFGVPAINATAGGNQQVLEVGGKGWFAAW